MNSLVGYGVSSDSDSDGEGEDGNTGRLSSSAGVSDDGKTRNFLLECGSSESGSGSEPEEGDPKPSLKSHPPSSACQPTLPAPSWGPPISKKLPPPPLNACSDSSVFANPFKAQAVQKLNALQKHVPLTMQAKPSQIGGKKMCVSYRKDGRCRFGINCKFAHDSDLQIAVSPSDCDQPVSNDSPARVDTSAGGSQNPQQEIAEESEQRKKKRVGLSNTLIPPKRAMKQYVILRDKERLNMC